ncbi:ADP-ribose pyrophosphatase YjhB (NUDIX family) [Yoonia maricola]|uniref:ADP-ribose pyrophosphatase YjhB (NUDIX family) n=1 Tax=Yoonia maricola TaxID=420999 RepID=A0A2M8W186_9RHOB|nr:NUDIX hydrolase [Yoonia maricola]PJI84679.1 ADP-ribose pyrophosphatase YjhB (NUDIX family) [Yoonia maricola]
MQPKLGAIAVVQHEERFLLVKRKKEPNAKTWGFPGGHVELGETALEAAVRELAEETGVVGRAERYLTNVDAITRDDDGEILFHYLLAVVICTYQSGAPVAADDVSDAGWFTPDQAAKLKQSPNLQQIIAQVVGT